MMRGEASTEGRSGAFGAPSFTVAFPPDALDALADLVYERLQKRSAGVQVGEGWFNVHQAAEYLACRPKRIYDLHESGRLRAARDGRRLLFRREWLDDALNTETMNSD